MELRIIINNFQLKAIITLWFFCIDLSINNGCGLQKSNDPLDERKFPAVEQTPLQEGSGLG